MLSAVRIREERDLRIGGSQGSVREGENSLLLTITTVFDPSLHEPVHYKALHIHHLTLSSKQHNE